MTEHHDTLSSKAKLLHRPLFWIGLAITIILLATVIILGKRVGATNTMQEPQYNYGNNSSHATNGLLAVITNSGSTNFPGWTLTLNADGSGSLTYEKGTQPANSQRLADKTFPARTFDITHLADTLTQIDDVSTIPNHPCIKSVSFGSTTAITYNGKTSGDVSCLSNEDPQIFLDVKAQVEMLQARALQG